MEPIRQKLKKEGRGKDTLFRVSYQHQGQLIQNADYKANIVISISTLIISGIIAFYGYGVVTKNGFQYGYVLIVPTIIIVLACLVALIYAVQATRPRFVYLKPSDAHDERSSLMFFRTIYQYSQKEYLEKMKELLDREEDIFEQMTIDLYNQGVILKRKYDLLRNAYSVLLFGFVASVLAFIVGLISQL